MLLNLLLFSDLFSDAQLCQVLKHVGLRCLLNFSGFVYADTVVGVLIIIAFEATLLSI